jgi:hypothetical protein
VFDLVKNGDIWTLCYRESSFKGVLVILIWLPGLVIVIGLIARSGAGVAAAASVALAFCGIMAYWLLHDSDSNTEFDLTRRCLTVDCKRPWFGAPRSFDFADVAALETKRQSGGETPDYWEVRLKLRDNKRILLGVAQAGRRKQVEAYIEEIQDATGIAARHVDTWLW